MVLSYVQIDVHKVLIFSHLRESTSNVKYDLTDHCSYILEWLTHLMKSIIHNKHQKSERFFFSHISSGLTWPTELCSCPAKKHKYNGYLPN